MALSISPMQNIHVFSSWSERQKLSRFELFTFFFLHVCDKVCNALADRNVVSFTSFLVSYTWFSPGLWIGLDPFKTLLLSGCLLYELNPTGALASLLVGMQIRISICPSLLTFLLLLNIPKILLPQSSPVITLPLCNCGIKLQGKDFYSNGREEKKIGNDLPCGIKPDIFGVIKVVLVERL